MCSKIVYGIATTYTTGGNFTKLIFLILSNLLVIIFQVTAVLQANEYTKEFNEQNSVKYYDSNQLASNNPIEDTRSEAQCLFTKGNIILKKIESIMYKTFNTFLHFLSSIKNIKNINLI